MAKEGSVAPKERINIKFKPKTGGAQSEIELPLKLLVLGDFLGREVDDPLEDRKRININKENFNDVMEEQNVSVDIAVKNRLSDAEDADEELEMSLNFKTLNDFHPENLVRLFPEMNQLFELREALQALKGPMGNVPAFRKAVQQALTDEKARAKLLRELGLNAEADG